MSSSGSDKESLSEVQSQLQGVLVTVKIQDPDKAILEKRVRFNSLVEVRFIPKVKAKKEKNKEDKEKRKCEERANGIGGTEGKENVAIGDESDTIRHDTKNEATKSDSEKKKTKINLKANSENAESGDNQGNVVPREGFFLPKVTIGQEYDGEVMRTTKVNSKPQPRNSIRLLRRGSKESRIHELNARSVVHLERQAAEFCREADRLFEEVASQDSNTLTVPSSRENVSESHRTSPQNPRNDQDLNNPVLHRCKSLPEFSRRTSFPDMKRSESQERGSETNSQKKLSTSLPYINMIPTLTGKTPETNQKDSYTKLYLPQLQRKAEEIKRLNETVLRKKPKYSPDRSQSSPSDPSPLGFIGDKNFDKNTSPPASSHSIVRYSHGLDIARLLNITNSTQLFY